ncbi:hypothetical protein K503DRAFT_803343 [Rhizopogon vinicolor AM-OR11-026]|uniref:Uncharacterized protein n=1 Tax=Rhizopogon vinicolor AM-OR11-026 TaxID=1314800 RepID=A0A1B7MQ62_9AGAM|nr:hypothetical protein K503DRAFT_803343 [Rhizopogon vinicolor AM-OR11-026]
MTEGLFQGYLLERVMHHIFTGPSTALGEDSRATRSCNLLKLNTLHMVVYSARNKWTEVDGLFNYRTFYYSIIDFIRECEDEDWVEKLFKWWNRTLFKNEEGRDGGPDRSERGSTNVSVGSFSAPMDGLARMRAQAAARAAKSKRLILPLSVYYRRILALPPLVLLILSLSLQCRSRRIIAAAPAPPKSPTPSDLMQEEDDDIENVSNDKSKATSAKAKRQTRQNLGTSSTHSTLNLRTRKK